MSTGARLSVLALVLVAGEVAGFSLERMSSAWPWGAGGLVFGALVAWGWKVPYAVVPLVFGFGMVIAARVECLRVETLDRHWLSVVGGSFPELDLPVEGMVEERELKRRGRVVQFLSHLGPTPLKVILPSTELARLPIGGEVWRCRGWVSRVPGANGSYSRRMFWGRSGNRIEGVLPGKTDRAKDIFARIGDRFALKAQVGLGWCPELAALNQAILLGRRTEIPHSRREVFVAAGTVHVFAISGMHVMFIAWMLLNILELIGVPIRTRGPLVVPFLVAYTLVTGARPSAIRATMMAGMYLLPGAVGRKGDLLSAWAVTALVVYGVSPERIHDAGCSLSFMVMLGIVIWLKWSRSMMPDSFRTGWLGALGVSMAAWAAGVPIAARVFGRFTLGGLVANLAVLRLAPFTVALGMMGIMAGFVCEPIAVIFNNVAAGFTFLMMVVSALVAGLPLSSMEVRPWSIVACVSWYATICGGVFILGRLRVRRRECWWRVKHKVFSHCNGATDAV